jgi:cytosine/adenosine deaminase-related metal-dependent hydrolase
MNPDDIQVLHDLGAAVVHNPTSNANNRVGLLPGETIQALRVGLGTDGKQANMLREAREGALIRSSHLPGGAPNADYGAMLFEHNPAIASRLFGCRLGHIIPGYRADLAIYDYHPRTEINETNMLGHMLYGLELPCHVMTRGEFRIRDGEFVQVDEGEVLENAVRQSARLWAAMAHL